MWDLRIDGDVLIYRAGFAADANSDELSHSLYNAKAIIKKLTLRFPGDCTIVLSNPDKTKNPRYALEPNYKLNRYYSNCCDTHVVKIGNDLECLACKQTCKAHSIRPKFFKEIRQYLLQRYHAKVVPWGECDDWLGVSTNKTNTTIIASIDKDLLMLPGYHYRMQSDKIVKSTDPGQLWLSDSKTNRKLIGTGLTWFMAQVILGDSVDNIISPCKGWGPVKVFNEFSKLKTVDKIWQKIVNLYNDEQLLSKNAQLLWISREARQLWTPGLMEALIEKNKEENK